jgi:thioredoxin
MARSVASSAEFKAVLSEAASKSATVIVDFTASWCGPCQRVAPAYAALAEEFKHVIFLKVDVDEAQELAQELRISAMPTFLAFVNEQQVAMVRGADESGLQAMVQQHAGNKWSAAGAGQTLGGDSSSAGEVCQMTEREKRLAALAKRGL